MKILLPQNYKLIMNSENYVVLAFNVVKNVTEPWVVWRIGLDGTPHTGNYFKDKKRAERKLYEVCFEWFEEVQECPKLKMN